MADKATDFVEKFYPFAVESEKQTKIPAVFTLAQGALETGWGQKSEGNNLFGITADKNWTGEKTLVKTFEFHDTPNVKYPEIESVTYLEAEKKYKYIVKRYFRKYKSFTDCFNDHNEFLLKPRYQAAFKYTDDPKAFASEVAKAGYATSLNYAATLAKVIDKIRGIIEKLGLDSSKAVGTFGVVNAERLNIRVEPSPQGKTVGVLTKGVRVKIFGKQDTWYKIREGVAGWVSADFITEEGVITAGKLNVREKPNGDKVGEILKGAKPEIIESVDGWKRISTEQWAVGTYIDIESAEETPQEEQA